MSLYINTNVSSLNAQRNLASSQSSLQTSLQRLSSGLRINSAKDDAAGLAIASRFTSQINGLDQATRNANDGISLAQTAEGALSSAGDMLQRIRQLAVQSMNATNSSDDRAALNSEVQQLTQELQRVATTTQFNGTNLLDGSFTAASFQVGANANQTIVATSGNFQTNAYGNYRVGSMAAQSQTGAGDLTQGATAGADSLHISGGDASTIASGSVTINTATGSKTISYTAGSSAADVAAAINQAGTGVQASAITQFVLGADDAHAGASGFYQNTTYTFYLSTDTASATGAAPTQGYTTVSFTTGGSASGSSVSSADQLNTAAQAFNDAAGKTGFTAKVVKTDNNEYGLVITSEAGKDLRISNQTSTGAAAQGTIAVEDMTAVDGSSSTKAGASSTSSGVLTSAVNSSGAWQGTTTSGYWITGHLVLDSSKSFSVTDTNGASGATSKGFMISGTAQAGQLQTAANMDVSTVDSAARTLAIADQALSVISAQRARYGALQSRFTTSIQNLQATSENLSASRSRIQDADFASETSSMSRAQVLQQAGLAMVAQANALPQQVLSLLK
ncbi:MAG TPA: flagellin [Rhodocyclaceae bacterium]